MKLALPGGSPKQQPDKICSQSETTTSSKGLTLMTWRSRQHIKDIRSFIDYPLFPKHPATVQFDMKTSLRLPFASPTGGWLFGSLLAPESGEYRFAVSSTGDAQLRLSKNGEPERSQIIASLTLSAADERPAAGQYNKHSSQTSLAVFLNKCRNYFIEVLFNNDQKNGHVEIAWETPSSLVYEIIPSFLLSPYIDAHDFAYSGDSLLIFEDTVKTSSLFWHFEREKRSVQGELLLDEWSRLPFMSSKHATGVVPSCSSELKSHASSPLLEIAKINSEMTLKFVDDYTKQLVKASQGKYSFTKLHDSEERTIDSEERRFLLNLEFKDNLMDMRVRISEYLFYAGDKRELCTINKFKWRRDAMVTIIAVIRKMDSWSHHFMDHLSEMTSKLRDARFSVVVVAPQKMKGYFQTIVSQNALSTHAHLTLLLISAKQMLNMQHIIKVIIPHIKVPNTIIFLTDIRVQMPTEILEHVRKRTVQGKTIFIPWPENFDPGSHDNATVINPLDITKEDHPPSFSMYLSDWQRLHDKKAASRNQNTDTAHKESWWQAIGNGALEIYASKIPKYFYFQEN